VSTLAVEKAIDKTTNLRARILAEFLGTGFLVAAVVGSGIMAQGLSAGNLSLALLENTVATASVLVALILTFGAISGAQFNPVITIADAIQGSLPWKFVPSYLLAQCLGGLAGVCAAHLMFGERLFQVSVQTRSGSSQLFSEFVATFGLIIVIRGCSRTRPAALPFAVGAYIAAAYWFTASTSFANPAVTLARCFSNTFTGIRPADLPGFVIMQFIGAMAATWLFRLVDPDTSATASRTLKPHRQVSGRASGLK
jgi:glycerol uptake facilitator-like aquaporin